MAAIGPLPQETIEVLRGKFAAADDTTWVLGVAAREGWLRANRGYLSAMRRRGVEEMAALMEAAAIRKPVSLEETLRLLEMAISLWAPRTTMKRVTRKTGEATLEIRAINCPVYAQLQKTGWRGVTACGNWHRRQGWYDALDLVAEDTLLREKKWGHGACVARVKLRQTRRLAEPTV